MKHEKLFDLSDEQLKKKLKAAIKKQKEYDQLVFDCQWHLSIRKNISKARISSQMEALQSRLDALNEKLNDDSYHEVRLAS